MFVNIIGFFFFRKEVLQHKTFHRYTVRAKRGTGQGLKDSQNRSHAPKSAGATLRRYNEAALVKATIYNATSAVLQFCHPLWKRSHKTSRSNRHQHSLPLLLCAFFLFWCCMHWHLMNFICLILLIRTFKCFFFCFWSLSPCTASSVIKLILPLYHC